MTLLRDKIIAALDRVPYPISIPEWNLDCFIRAWSVEERNNFLARFVGVSDNKKVLSLNMDAHSVLLSLADEKGERLLSDDDLGMVLEKNGGVVSRIGEEAMKFNGIGNTSELKKS